MSVEKTDDIEAHTARTDVPPDNVSDLKHEQETRHLGTLNRNLKSRHIQFLALSGAIGTGLFVGSGQVISLAGNPRQQLVCREMALTVTQVRCQPS